jgi:DICT domain-containing protein
VAETSAVAAAGNKWKQSYDIEMMRRELMSEIREGSYMYHTSWICSEFLCSLDEFLPMMDLFLHFYGVWDAERKMKAGTVNP